MMLLTLDPERKAIVFGLAAVGLWSTVATAFTLSLQFVSPLVLVTLASAASWLLFALIITATRQWSRLLDATPRDCWIALAIGTLNPGLYYTLLFEAYARLPAQEAMALNYTWALTLPLLAAPLLKQALQRRDIIAALISYVGVFVIATHGEPWTLTLNEPTGIALAMGSTLIWGLCWIANTQHALNPVHALFLNFSAATPMLFVVVYLSDGFQDIPLGGLLGGALRWDFRNGDQLYFLAKRHATHPQHRQHLYAHIPVAADLSGAYLAGIRGTHRAIYPDWPEFYSARSILAAPQQILAI